MNKLTLYGIFSEQLGFWYWNCSLCRRRITYKNFYNTWSDHEHWHIKNI